MVCECKWVSIACLCECVRFLHTQAYISVRMSRKTHKLISLTWHQLQSLSDSLTGKMLGSPNKRYGVVSTLLQTSQLCLTHSPSTDLSTVSCVASGVEDGVANGVSQWRGRSPGESD